MDAAFGGPGLIDPAHRSPDPAICPFLRSVDADDRLGTPVEFPDPRNHCVATGTPDPQDSSQQRSACLTAGHVSCPRYLSGVAAPGPSATDAPAPPPADTGPTAPDLGPATAAADLAMAAPAVGGDGPDRPGRGQRTLTPAVIAATVFLVASASAAIAFVSLRGGLELPQASPGASTVAVASPTPEPTPTPELTPEPTLEPTPVITPAPTPEPTPVATLPATPSPAATSNRYALLEACPDKPDCYIYTVRTGDNLASIANYFGVPYATVLDLNPQIGDPSTIQPGDRITLPPPTR